jgi:gluconate kinase
MVSPAPTSGDNLPALLFFFGLAGAGKTFCGNLISARLGYHCYDLDSDCTPVMRAAIAEGSPFTDAMRDDFFEIVSRRIGELKERYSKVLVMQAAYKERHRAWVASKHPGVALVWVDAPDELIAQRLQARGDAVSAEYATKIRANFQPPSGGPRLINDVTDPEQLLARFNELFSR